MVSISFLRCHVYSVFASRQTESHRVYEPITSANQTECNKVCNRCVGRWQMQKRELFSRKVVCVAKEHKLFFTPNEKKINVSWNNKRQRLGNSWGESPRGAGRGRAGPGRRRLRRRSANRPPRRRRSDAAAKGATTTNLVFRSTECHTHSRLTSMVLPKNNQLTLEANSNDRIGLSNRYAYVRHCTSIIAYFTCTGGTKVMTSASMYFLRKQR